MKRKLLVFIIGLLIMPLASCSGEKFTIFFDLRGGTPASGSAIASQVVKANGFATEPDNPSKTYYQFKHWTLDLEAEVPFEFASEKIVSDTTLYAVWASDLFKVNFNVDGGEPIASRNYKHDETVTLPTPTKKGHTFDGWFTLANGQGEKISLSTTWSGARGSEVTLFAFWKVNSYTITFDFGEANEPNTQDLSQSVKFGDSYTLPVPSKIGHYLVGWFDKDSIKYTDSSGVSIVNWDLDENMTLTAIFAAQSYEVTFDLNGGTFVDDSDEVVTVKYYENFGELPEAEKDGYDFAGWYYNNGETEILIEDEDVNPYVYSSSIVLKASWKALSYKILSFDPDEGIFIDGSEFIAPEEDYEFDSEINLPVLKKDGYVFEGWHYKIDEDVFKLTDGDGVGTWNIASDIESVYAMWSLKKTKVIFDVNGGIELENEFEYLTYTEYVELPVAERVGYDFKGWAYSDNHLMMLTDENGLGDEWTNYAANEIEVYAIWEAKEYTITLDPGLGELSQTSVTATYDEDFNLPIPTYLGFKMVGWFLDAVQITDEKGDSLEPWTFDKDQTLTALYDHDTFSITFDSNHSDTDILVPDSFNVQIISDSIDLKMPENYGENNFIGWGFTPTAAIADTFMKLDPSKIFADKTLYAIWGTATEGLIYTKNATSDGLIVSKDPSINYIDKELIIPEVAIATTTLEKLPVTAIAANTFKSDAGFEYISLPSSLEIINNAAFQGTKIVKVFLKEKVKQIGGDAFRDCVNLKTINIPDAVTAINNHVFSGCITLTNVILSKNITSIGTNSFNNCQALKEITLPESLITIGNNSFNNCLTLKELILPMNLVKIGDYALANCKGISSIYIPLSVTIIGERAFDGWGNDQKIYLPFAADAVIFGSSNFNEDWDGGNESSFIFLS